MSRRGYFNRWPDMSSLSKSAAAKAVKDTLAEKKLAEVTRQRDALLEALKWFADIGAQPSVDQFLEARARIAASEGGDK